MLLPGQIAFTVMAKSATNEPNRLIAASIGLARPTDHSQYGYLSEHHSYGETAQKAGNYAEDMAMEMLATTIGLPDDLSLTWDQREALVDLDHYHYMSRLLHYILSVHRSVVLG